MLQEKFDENKMGALAIIGKKKSLDHAEFHQLEASDFANAKWA